MKTVDKKTASGRKVLSRGKMTIRSLVNMPGIDSIKTLESLLQKDWIYVLWWMKNVVVIDVEPPSIEYLLMGECRTYHPDFKIVLNTGEIFYIETKPSEFMSDEMTAVRYKAVERQLEEDGYGFMVLTEKELPLSKIAIETLQKLKWYALSPETSAEELEKLTPDHPITLRELTDQLSDSTKAMEMLANQLLSFDLSKPLRQSTQLHKTEEIDYVYL